MERIFFINESQILYIEAKLRNCDIFMQNGEVIHGKKSFADFEKSLDEYFVKVSQKLYRKHTTCYSNTVL